MDSPLGSIEIKGTEQYITSVLFVDDKAEPSSHIPQILNECKQQLEEYFTGKRVEFVLSLNPEGTIFQKEVWQQLLQLPFGTTTTYGAIAKSMNKDEGAARAVGNANGKNPVAIIIPCHRVIGDNGKLTGYAGGVWRKDWLLKHEGNISGKNPTLF